MVAALCPQPDGAAPNFSTSYSYEDQHSLLVQTDKALQELGKESEDTNDVIFAVDPDWVVGGDIAPERQVTLQELTKALSLQPKGFVVTSESVYQQTIQREPLASQILIELRDELLQVVVIQRGTLLGVQQVGRSGDLAADLTEALARFGKDLGHDHLPSRLILHSEVTTQDELQQLQQELLSSPWGDALPFLQQPEVEVAKEHFLLEQVLGQATQSLDPVSKQSGAAPVPPKAAAEPMTAIDTEFGFAPYQTSGDNFHSVNLADEQDAPAATARGAGSSRPAAPQKMVQGLRRLLFKEDQKTTAVAQTVHHSKLEQLSHKPFVLLGVGLGLVVLLILAVGYAVTQHRVEVVLELNSKVISKTAELTLDPGAALSDVERAVLPAELTQVEVAGSESLATTGVKLIGEKAQGQVVIYNKTTAEKIFEAGSVLQSGSRKFTLDQEVSIASASVQTQAGSETKVFGKAEVAVTASDIGSEGNLEKGTKLSLASFDSSSYEAEVLEKFNGGSSREVRVVSDKDVANLTKNLTQKLQQDAEQQLKDQSGKGRYFVATGQVETLESTFDAKVGDEVQSISLDLKLSVAALGYDLEQLRPLAAQLLADQVPSGYRLSEQDPQILSAPDTTQTASASGRSQTAVKLTAEITSSALPIINTGELAGQLAGRPNAAAESTLNTNPAIKAVKISVEPALFARFFSSWPNSAENISITIVEPK